ncbi:DUF2201 family putative metallopeptidase [Pseudomonas aeruginosa]
MRVKYRQVRMLENPNREFLNDINLLLTELRNFSPFLAILATQLHIAGPCDPKQCKTAMVSPKGVMVYNEDWLMTKSVGEIAFIIIHEALHVAFNYWDRFGHANHRIGNKAHDYAINQIISEMAANLTYVMTSTSNGSKSNNIRKFEVKRPAGALFDQKYHNMSAEEIYVEIWDQIKARTAQIEEQKKEILSDPEKLKEYERQRAIQKELRESLIQGLKVISSKQKDIDEKFGFARRSDSLKALEAERSDFRASARHGASSITYANDHDYSGPEYAHGMAPAPSADTLANKQMPKPATEATTAAEWAGYGEAEGRHDKSLKRLNSQLEARLLEYMKREEERIAAEYDKSPVDTTREGNLETLSNELDTTITDYVDEVMDENPPTPSGDGDEGGNQGKKDDCDAEDGGNRPDQSADADEADGDSNDEGYESDEPGNGEGQEPGREAGDQKSGRSKDQEQGESLDDLKGGSQSPAPDSQSGGGSGSGPASGSDAGGANNEEPLSKSDALGNAADALDNLRKDIADALNGQGGMDGIDQDMASGEDSLTKGSEKQAMDEILGAESDQFEGDTELDCSNIPGNPFKDETPDDTRLRHQATLSRAIEKDAEEKNGQGWGSLPGHAKKMIDDILHPPPTFDQRMKRFVGAYGIPSRGSRYVPNKRNTYLPNMPIRPGIIPNDSNPILLIDTSGSTMNPANLAVTKQAIAHAVKLFKSKGVEVTVIMCDAEVRKVMKVQDLMKELRAREFALEGLGGSDFRPAFEEIWEMIKKDNMSTGIPIMVVTDGEIDVPEEPPRWAKTRQQTLWITPRGMRAPTTKWGEHVEMDPPSP